MTHRASRHLLRLALVASLAAGSVAFAQPSRQPMDPKVREIYQHYPVVELVTMGIGSLMWEKHGHIALCVRHKDPRRDLCYNYGTANFHQPLSMAWGFLRGTDSFWASADTPGRMLSIYHRADRTIWTQPLPLTDEQEQEVIAKLESDVKEENKYYAYDHFWDNCTTRARDIIDDATGGALRKMTGPTGKTYRELARHGFVETRWAQLVTDIAMGRTTDDVANYYQKMFLPQYMREAVETHWGIKPIVLYQRQGPPHPKDGPTGRVLLALFILLWTIPAWATRKWGRFERTGIAVAIAPMVILGLLLWTVAIISPISYLRYNESVLIFFPLDVLLVALPAAKRLAYARFRLGMLGLIAFGLAVGLLKQPLWAPLLWPLIPAATVALWPRKSKEQPASA